MTSNNAFLITGRLPGYNEQCASDRASKYAGYKLRQDTERHIVFCIKRAIQLNQCRHVNRPCVVHFTWGEKDRRRDVDNIVFAKKYILDAMQQAGILERDSQRWVHGCVDEVVKIRRGQSEYVYVEIFEDEEAGHGAKDGHPGDPGQVDI